MMTTRLDQTAHGDAPLSAAKTPDARSAPGAQPATTAHDTLVGRTVSINRTPEALYAFWRDFAQLPRFMENIHSVTVHDERHSHWVVAAPAGQTVEWDSEITEDRPNELIAWQSTPGASIRNSGRVEFTPSSAGRGTLVRVNIVYDPPAGAIGKLLAKLFAREPRVQARHELRRFKQLMETGEISTALPPDAAPRA